jgi:membrane protease YdiL (CAAX protease family)
VFTVAIVTIVLGYTWLLAPITARSTAYVAGSCVVALAIWRAAKTAEWGLRTSAFLPALWRAAAFTAAGALGLYVAGTRLGTWHDRGVSAAELALLFLWGLGQQFVLQTVILREATVLMKADTTDKSSFIPCVAAAFVFASLHVPNPFLSAVTFAGALVWCWIYSRYPNILPLALSHAVLTAAILYAFDDRITGRLRIGAGYLALR